MRNRLDVRKMLLARGWEEQQFGLLTKGGATIAVHGSDAFLGGLARRGRGEFTVDFPYGCPAAVIVAAAEAAAGGGQGG